jgi:hypothetical protein
MGRLPALVSILVLGGWLTGQPPVPKETRPSPSIPMPTLPAIRTMELLKHLNQQVTVEGYFYDGSIPMLVDDFEKIRVNALLTPASYLPLVGRKLNLKWGDHVKIKGLLVPGKPPLAHESAVLRLKASTRVEVIQASPLK